MCYAGAMNHRFQSIDIDKEVAELIVKNTTTKSAGWLPKQQKDDFFDKQPETNDDGLVKLWNEKIIIELRNSVRQQTGMI